MLQGPSFSIYEEISAQTAHPIIVSGGVSSKKDIEQLRKRNLYGATSGSAV
jgi:phosphoribosylformimino-5-aminoimidazole carboxamide ribonucleotide (ProFAR) isomerase